MSSSEQIRQPETDEGKTPETYEEKLAQLQEHSAFLGRERQRVLLGLGEAVWQEFKKGALDAPPSLSAALRTVEAVERQRVAHAAEISALLAEGAVPQASVDDLESQLARKYSRVFSTD